MAKNRTSSRNTGNVTNFPIPQTGIAVAEEAVEPPDGSIPQEFAEPSPEPPAATEERPARRAGRPKGTPEPQDTDFWKQVREIPRADWGTRVYLYLYILEPLCNLKQSGGKVYLNRYAEPVQDEHQICLEYGSGRYRLMLAKNKISPDQSNELARHEFEIYNPQHPPKVPRAAWVNDTRNAKWEALLPKETPQTAGAAAASTIVDAMKMVTDIRAQVRDEMEPEPTDQQTPSEMVNTFRQMKEILQPAGATAAAKDPIELATALATTMMQMKADNPIVDILRDELKAMRDEAAKGRDREFQLQQQLMEAKNKPAADSGDFLDRIIQLSEKAEKMEGVKKLFGNLFGGAAETVTRAGRTSAYDVIRDIASSPFGASLGQGLGMLVSNLAIAGQPPAMNGAPRPTGPTIIQNPTLQNGAPPVENPEQRIQRIGQTITTPMLYEFFLKDESGATWAERMFDMWPEDYIFLRNLGAENIVQRYRQFAPAWAIIGPKEPAFVEFMQEFCAWNPNEDEGPTPHAADDDGVRDLEEEAGA